MIASDNLINELQTAFTHAQSRSPSTEASFIHPYVPHNWTLVANETVELSMWLYPSIKLTQEVLTCEEPIDFGRFSWYSQFRDIFAINRFEGVEFIEYLPCIDIYNPSAYAIGKIAPIFKKLFSSLDPMVSVTGFIAHPSGSLKRITLPVLEAPEVTGNFLLEFGETTSQPGAFYDWSKRMIVWHS